MPFVVLAAIAIVGAAIQIRRHRHEDPRPLAADTLFVWWLVVGMGVGGIIGALFHLLDGKAVAEQIGYTRGNGGFQFENAIGDLSLGIAAVLCFKFRGYFWLAVVIIAAIQFFGDAAGHIYFWLVKGNTKPDNVGIPLVFDFIGPIVAIVLYAISWKQGGDARPRTVRRQSAPLRQPA